MSHGSIFRPAFARTLRPALGCSLFALATALAAPAAAQQATGSFQGSATVTFGSANVSTGTGTTTVTVNSQSAVIDWTPSDTAVNAGVPINWQPAGTNATYIGNGPNFAVLNRIVPVDTSRPITFNGTVSSLDFGNQNPVPGGILFFYSPGGIVLGPSAVFDVGSLGLTSAAPVVDGNGGWYTNNTVQFGQANTQSGVIINAGAQITATQQGSYVAAFAPLIQHGGTITTNGQAALVAGEAGTITFSPDGLFDIQVTTGTGRGGNVHNTTGDITGPASSGAGDNHRIYMVAVPKNQVITMSIQRGASLGFDIAGAANIQGNAVVLTAGYNVTDGVAETARAGGGGTGSISINDSNANLAGTGIDFTSAVNANASAGMGVQVFRQTRFASDAYLRADNGSQVSVSALANMPAGSLMVAGDLTVAASRPGNANATSDAGDASFFLSNAGTASIGGTVRIDADADRDLNGDGVVTGARAFLSVAGGANLTIGTDLVVTKAAFSDGAPGAPDAQGGTGGGNQSVNVSGASTVSVGRVTRLVSNGIAGANNGTSGQGGDGRGGQSFLIVQGGSNFTTSELNIAADGVGGADIGGGGGTGTGGTASIQVSGANSVLTVQNPNATGNVNFGEFDLLSAESFGGTTALAGGTGGLAQGGSAIISVSAGGRLALPTQANAFARILARAYGGDASGDGSTGGEGRGGNVSISVDGGTLTGEALIPSSFAQGGGDPQQLATGVVNGGNGIGGTRVIAFTNGAIFTGSITGGGPSGVGGAGSATGRGGDGSGGIANTIIDASTLNVTTGGFLTFTQNTGGGGATGGNASGGAATVQVIGGSVVNLATGARFSAGASAYSNGLGGPVTGTGGSATAGSAGLFIDGSTIRGDGLIEVTATGFAGDGPIEGGAGQGGSAFVNVTNGVINAASLTVTADGEGSAYAPVTNATSGASGGAGIGGQASVFMNGATLTVPTIEIGASGQGGVIAADGATGLTGGAATGGSAILHSQGGTNTITSDGIRLEAVGEGGAIEDGSGSGGNGTGGQALLQAFAGLTRIVSGSIIIGGDGSGGDAGGLRGETGYLGGLGTGGQGQLTVGADGSLEIEGDVEVSGEARGGNALFIDPDTGEEVGIGTGGNAAGGQALIQTSGGQLSIEGDVDFDGEDEGGAGITGGNVTAGQSTLSADGGSIALTGTVSIVRSAEGGAGATGGNAIGSTEPLFVNAYVLAQDGGTITIDGSATLDFTATGGAGTFLTGTGGSASGGRTASLAVGGGAITYNGTVTVNSNAFGGGGAVGGSAAAGIAYLQSTTDGTTVVNGSAFVRADAAAAGYDGGFATGGAATGGTAQILATDGNARLTINGEADVSANAEGGTGGRDAQGNGGAGGAATAGLAEIGGAVGTGNVLAITGSANLDATANGGLGLSVSGGNATAGRGFFSAGDGTSLTIGGSASAIVDAYAGDVDSFADLGAPAGTRGGDGFGGVALLQVFGTGGAVSIGGNLYLSPFAFGGDVSNPVGDGGNATIGRAQVLAQNGTVTLGSFTSDPIAEGGDGDIGGNALTTQNPFAASIIARNAVVTITGSTDMRVEATGGDGRDGGAGGSAVAAGTLVDADSSANGASTITLADLFAQSDAQGGFGGDGGTGGVGGAATSGPVQVLGTAGNGTLAVTGFVSASSTASGGAGGQGSAGSGGTGGAARSGFVQVGTKSGADVGPVNAGSASFADVAIDSTATGGDGGSTDTGTGGAGGNAISGGGVLLVRGSPVIAGEVTVSSGGIGGDGGAGATQGAGGFGAAGPAALAATQRAGRTERGTVSIDSLNLVSAGVGGAGSTPGASYFAGDGGVSLIQSDATIGALTAINSGDLPPPPAVIEVAQPIELVLSSATLEVDVLAMTTAGDFLLDLNNSTIDAGTFTINAGDFVLPATPPAQPGTITVSDLLSLSAASGSIRTFANFVIRGDASYSALEDIVLGDIEAEGSFSAQTEGIITVGDLDVGGATLTAGGNVQAGNVRSSGEFTAQSESGSVTVGTIDAPDVALLAATNLSAQRITSSDIVAEAGGTASVLGAWTAPSILLTAIDLAIPDGGSLAAGATGSVQLISLNGAGGFIGDGLGGEAGFRVGNAEFGRISGNSIFVGVLDTQGNAVDLTIGNLSLAAAQLPGSGGEIEFATGLGEGEPSGRIRVDGALAGSGFAASQYLSFTTGSFEINAEAGSIALTGNGPGGLGGIVYIDAANIHVAAPSILGRLRDDPRYEGIADELNAPATQQRPEGVLRALGLELYPSDTLYIQNTGTAQNPAGFLTTLEESDIEPPGFEDGGAPDVDVIINGRFATASGEITGADAFAAVVENAESLEGFSALSQINGCAFSAETCAPLVDEGQGLGVLQSEFELLNGQRLEEEPFDLDEGSEEEEEEAEQAARAPIEPPVVLIDTRPLNPPVDIVDPVSGSGNPAALAPVPAAPPPAATEGDGQ